MTRYPPPSGPAPGKTVRFRLTLPGYLNPLFVFTLTWTTGFLLYAWRISAGLVFDAEQALLPVSFIMASYLVPALTIAYLAKAIGTDHEMREIDLDRLKARTRGLLILWAAINLVQVAVMGGVPLVWLVVGGGPTYSEFGIPSVNGLAFALGLALGMLGYLLYEFTGEKRWLFIVLLMVFWGILTISRKFFVVALLQTVILFLITHRVSGSVMIKSCISLFAMVLLFGYVGDARTGRSLIMQYAYLTVNYPDWAPSGLVWVYMYFTTPINNIANIFWNFSPEWNYSFARTFEKLLPSIIRSDITDNGGLAGRYWLVSDVFNVSTAYSNSYLDVGLIGVAFFNFIVAGLTAGFYYFAKSVSGKLMYVVFIQALALTIFNDNFTNLNNCFQIAFIFFAFRGIERTVAGKAAVKEGNHGA
jgi:oligosaccharide repeat unit polymerase